MRFATAVGCLVLFLSGCGDDELAVTSPSTTSTIEDASVVPTFTGPGSCDDTASVGAAACAAGVSVDGTFYAISCGPVRPDAVSAEVIAQGTYAGVPTELRRIDGVATDLLVAIRLDGGVCGEGDEVASPWSMAFPQDSAGRPETQAAVCAFTLEEHRERDGCAAGS